jgi:hypothetical protein
MKTLLIAALLFSTPALADAVDDYAACLIGQSAVAIHNGAKDAEAAQEAAHGLCKEPVGIAENEAEGLLDYVNLVVEGIASQQ